MNNQRSDPSNFDAPQNDHRTEPKSGWNHERTMGIVEELIENYRSGNWNKGGTRVTRSLATLEKIYKEENKYSGQKESGQNNNFDNKL
jgi:hypothetical protein